MGHGISNLALGVGSVIFVPKGRGGPCVFINHISKCSGPLPHPPPPHLYFLISPLDDPSEAQKEEFTFEIEQMKLLGSHKNVVSMVGCCTLEEKVFLVIEYVLRGDLLTWLRRRRKKVRKSRKSHCSLFSCSERVDQHFL